MSRVIVRPSRAPAVVTRPSRMDRISPLSVAVALGANSVQEAPAASHGSPMSLLAVRQALVDGLRSIGGRPGLPDVTRRKIPLADSDWRAAEAVVTRLAEQGVQASPSQVVSVMLTKAFSELSLSEAAVQVAEAVPNRTRSAPSV